MNKINKLAILSLFFSVLPLILLLIIFFSDLFNSALGIVIYGLSILLFYLSLFISPFITLILGAIVLIKRKSSSKLFILLAVMGIVIAIITISISIFIFSDIFSPPTKARDPRRQSDIRQISIAMEMYYDENNEQYLQSEVYPTAIGRWLTIMPKDPGNGPCSSYQWVSNMSDPQKYCAWACSEYQVGKFFVASPKGIKISDKAPTDLNCGEEATTACTEEAKICPDGSSVGRTGPNCEFAPCPQVNSLFSEGEARIIAEKSCIKGGEALSAGIYNQNTKTWWFDANLNAVREGCNPACVVSEETKTAEINWRCTGLIP